jgi:A/G-specific adenine glycosylase
LTNFANQLYLWHRSIDRDLPWKESKDPYKIWLSEIILQQTRVEQGKPYYLKFINKWPTIFDLAKASEDEVLTMWQGLGYYSRGRNLLKTAVEIVENYGGKIPNELEKIKKLKGIGDYTSAAILSFAFDLPHPVIDGNVKRVISRYFGVSNPVDAKESSDLIKKLVLEVFDYNQPARFNQSIMDFGAIQCTPTPLCDNCPLQESCFAFAHSLVDVIPLKSKKIIKKDRFFNYFLIFHDNVTFISKRNNDDIWSGLYEFPLLETTLNELSQSLIDNFLTDLGLKNFKAKLVFNKKQILTHQNIFTKIYHVNYESNINLKGYLKVYFDDLDLFAFPQVLVEGLRFLKSS